jgi:hypothetical protein
VLLRRPEVLLHVRVRRRPLLRQLLLRLKEAAASARLSALGNGGKQ